MLLPYPENILITVMITVMINDKRFDKIVDD